MLKIGDRTPSLLFREAEYGFSGTQIGVQRQFGPQFSKSLRDARSSLRRIDELGDRLSESVRTRVTLDELRYQRRVRQLVGHRHVRDLEQPERAHDERRHSRDLVRGHRRPL